MARSKQLHSEKRFLQKSDVSRQKVARRDREGRANMVKEWVASMADPPRPSISDRDENGRAALSHFDRNNASDRGAEEWARVLDLYFTSERSPSLRLQLPESRFGELVTRRRSHFPQSPPPFSSNFNIPHPPPTSPSADRHPFTVRRSTSIKRTASKGRLRRRDVTVPGASIGAEDPVASPTPSHFIIIPGNPPPQVPRKAAALLGLKVPPPPSTAGVGSHFRQASQPRSLPSPSSSSRAQQWGVCHARMPSWTSSQAAPPLPPPPTESIDAQPPTTPSAIQIRKCASLETLIPPVVPERGKFWRFGLPSPSSRPRFGAIKNDDPEWRSTKTVPTTPYAELAYVSTENENERTAELEVLDEPRRSMKRRTRDEWEWESERLRLRIRESLGY